MQTLIKALSRRKSPTRQLASVSRYALPPLSSVQHPAREIGQLAAVAMLQMLRGEKPVAEVPAPRVVARESSRAPAGKG